MIDASLPQVKRARSRDRILDRGAASCRTLSAEARLILASFRDAVGATASALLVPDEEERLLRVQWRVPAGSGKSRTHPISGSCLLTRALAAREVVSARGSPPRRAQFADSPAPDCQPCHDLSGATAVFVVPVTIGPGQLALVAAFAPPGSRRRPHLGPARRLAEHLATFLRSYSVAEQVERRATQLAEIDEVAASLTSIVDADTLFSSLLTRIDRFVHHDVSTFHLLDPAERRIRMLDSRGFPAGRERLMEGTAWEHVCHIVFDSQQSVVLHDLRPFQKGDCAPQQRALLERLRAAMFVPIAFGGESLGVIGLGSGRYHAFGAEERDAVVRIANHVAIAIANSQFYWRSPGARSHLLDLTNLSQVTEAIGASLQTGSVLQNILRGTADAFRASRSVITLLDDEHDELIVASAYGIGSTQSGQRFPVAGTANGWVVRNGRPLFVASVPDSDFDRLLLWYERGAGESFISVPLFLHGNTVGALSVYSRRGYRYEASDVELLRSLASQAAIALEHAQLYQFAAREKAKLEAIVESLHEGLLLIGPLGKIVYASRRFIDLLGLEDGIVENGAIDQVWDWLVQRSLSPTETGERLRALQPDSARPLIVALGHPRGRDLELRAFEVRMPGDDLLGRGYLVRDVTQEAEVERLKASILSTVSHELRTPLASIKGFATTLLRTDIEWDESSKLDFVKQIDSEADRLGVLVRNLLDMSRLEAGVIRLDREWCDIGDLVADVVGRMAPLVAEHHLDVIRPEDRILARVDRRYLERVIWNLVDNAVKYSPSGSNVAIGVARDGAEVLFTVRDQGIGIGPEDRERVFERFYRVAGTRIPGLGLGLAISRGIVEAHGGTISLASAPQAGSLFTVRLLVSGKS